MERRPPVKWFVLTGLADLCVTATLFLLSAQGASGLEQNPVAYAILHYGLGFLVAYKLAMIVVLSGIIGLFLRGHPERGLWVCMFGIGANSAAVWFGVSALMEYLLACRS